ncbi:CopD family protein [Mycobacterium sp. NPDC006124]|uniref:CopD family protein n=1 Tax=Mycobacterium sp. NPDC006124 TaxID=3156729 RepID=UPI0033B45E20
MVALGALCVGGAAGLAWALSQSSPADGLVRAACDLAAVTTLGLVVVPAVDVGRHRDELAVRAARPLVAVSALWAVAELIRLFLGAVEAAGSSAARVGVRTTAVFAVDTAVGRAGLVCLLAALVVGALALASPGGAQPSSTTGVVAVGAAAIGMAGRSLVGHLSESPWGGLAVAVHALAAALWCGVLAALVLVVTHRGQWARVLPRFSQMSFWCVVVLLAFGVVGAVTTLHSPADLYESAYGRVLAAKLVVTVGLVVLAARNRAGWLPAARSHRVTVDVSRGRSRLELAVMAVALTLAAALAVTG